MRCLQKLGRWKELSTVAEGVWFEAERQGSAVALRKMAAMATQSAWALGIWDDMGQYMRWTDPSTLQGLFFRAVHATHRGALSAASRYVDRARHVLAGKLSTQAAQNESYGRMYRNVVTA